MAISLKIERRAFLWRLWPRVTPAEANKAATLDEVISVLEAEQGAGRARVFLDADGAIIDQGGHVPNAKNQLYIAEIRRDPARKIITLLINRGDPGWVDPALLDPAANEVRVERPGAKEAPGWSAHLVISTQLHGGAHRACFEQMQRVSGSLVLDALDRIVATALAGNPAYTFELIKTKKGKPHITHPPYRPALQVSRAPSERLVDDLEHGVLSGVTLTREKKEYAGISVDQKVRKIEEKVVISVQKTIGLEALNYLRKLYKEAKPDFESMQIHIGNLPGKQSSNPVVSLHDQDELEHLYVRAKRLTDFKVILEQCYKSICKPIENKLLEEINNASNWGQ